MKSIGLPLVLFWVNLLVLSGCGSSTSSPSPKPARPTPTPTGTPPSSTNNKPAPKAPLSLPEQITLTGSYKNSPTVISSFLVQQTYLFTYEVSRVAFSPSSDNLEFSYTQLDLSTAQSFQIISPINSGCVLANPFGFVRDGQHDLAQFFVNEAANSTACLTLLTQMKANGFHIKFTDVKYYKQSESVKIVEYKVSP